MLLAAPAPSPWLAPIDGVLTRDQLASAPPPDAPGKKRCNKRRAALVEELAELQHALYADDRYSVLLVFQASDAAGKDGTIRAVLSGVNPAGVDVRSFKVPTPDELDHDFLWRTGAALPAPMRSS